MDHSLHTAIIDRSGHLVANIEGNEVTSQQLGDLIEEFFIRASRSILLIHGRSLQLRYDFTLIFADRFCQALGEIHHDQVANPACS